MKQYLTNTDWKNILKSEFSKDYFVKLTEFLDYEYSQGKIIYPEKENIFSALNLLSPKDVKVVILGQDPYHGKDQAHGLSFSVNKGIKIPPSLVNIYKELNQDLSLEIPNHGHLESWAKQGVLLLNNTLTVEASKAGSHQKKGWESFTDSIIHYLNERHENLVFILWGAPAQKKAACVDANKHLILSGPHPSPLSSYRGFFGSKPFSQTNKFLKDKGFEEIDWKIT